VGGEEVSGPGVWPWQASLEFASSGSHTCGAVLLSERWVLCAAHCTGNSPSSYNVVLGLHDRTTRRQGKPATYSLSTITRHPSYVQDGNQGFPNDIAVIRLASAADINIYVSPANLPDTNGPDFTGYNCYITGWGRLYGFGPLPNVLNQANVDILSESECRGYWGSRITDIHICLMDKDTQQRGACNGDSGGPLVCQTGSTDEPSSYTLAGITSWGRSGCSTDYPSVYVRVTTFRSWIQQQTGL